MYSEPAHFNGITNFDPKGRTNLVIYWFYPTYAYLDILGWRVSATTTATAVLTESNTTAPGKMQQQIGVEPPTSASRVGQKCYTYLLLLLQPSMKMPSVCICHCV
jgi:hypothetical protein